MVGWKNLSLNYGRIQKKRFSGIMKKEVEMKNDGKDFDRFENLLREVIKVPKDEILRREKAEKEKRKLRKAKA